MNRLGFRHDNLARTLPEVAASRHLAIDAVYTHFATADDPEHPAVRRAARRVSSGAGARCRRLGIDAPRRRHAANSAALLRDERVWYDFVRPGLLLYGIVPPPLAVDAAAATCPVTAQPYRGGEGHARRRRARATACTRARRQPATIAVVPAGYADGLDLRLAGRGFMLVRGRRAPDRRLGLHGHDR